MVRNPLPGRDVLLADATCVLMKPSWQAAWSLALAEMVTVSLAYYFLVPEARHLAHYKHLHYSFGKSLEVAAASCMLAGLPLWHQVVYAH